MEKKTKMIIIGVISAFVAVVVITLVAVFMILNTEKTSMTAEEFYKKMEEKNFIIADATSQFEEYDYVKKTYVTAPQDYGFKIEFYELSNDEEAIKFFENNKSIFEQYKGDKNLEKKVNLKNSNKYVLRSNGEYRVISRINNTAIYLSVGEQYEAAVKQLLEELGY